MKTIHSNRLRLILLLLVIGAGCRRGAVELVPTDLPTPTAVIGFFDGTYAPIVTRTSAVTVAPNATEADNSPCVKDTSIPTARYDITATVDLDNRAVTAGMNTIYHNQTGQPLKQIVFDVEPNLKPGQFTLSDVAVPPGTPTEYQVAKYVLVGSRLEITLNNALDVNCEATLILHFTVHVPSIPSGYLGKVGYFGYSDRQINLGEWLPVVAPFVNGDWLTPQFSIIGENTVDEMGDFTAKIALQGGDKNNLPIVIGPGSTMQLDDRTWYFNMQKARSLSLSISYTPALLSIMCDNGVTVDLYYYPKGQPDKSPSGAPIDGPQHALETAKAAINLYQKLYGPIPYKRLVIVEGDFPDGMEFSGIVFVSHQWFASYDGKPDSWLTLITAHELAHQWFYSLVTNNQAMYPYLDEAFATYNELLFLEDQYPTLTDWWWQFRVKLYNPYGYVDASIYDFQNIRLYINAVYLRGVSMIQDVRTRLGDDEFFHWLHTYVAAESGKIATSADLWQAMSSDDYAKTADIRAKYFKQPDPLHPPMPTQAATTTP